MSVQYDDRRVRQPAPRVERVNLRTLAKSRTRVKVLEAARRRFVERGFEGATIRDIAEEAGMSTGAVFASFADKAELFSAVVLAEFEGEIAAMREAVAVERPAAEGLAALFAVGYAHHLREQPMTQTGLGAWWSPSPEIEQRTRVVLDEIPQLAEQLLRRAAEAGELRAGADLKLASELLWNGYMANYRLAFFSGWSEEQVNTRMQDQIALLLQGLKTG